MAIVFIPFMFGWIHRRVRAERDAIDIAAAFLQHPPAPA
jgi:hypothetical protein